MQKTTTEKDSLDALSEELTALRKPTPTIDELLEEKAEAEHYADTFEAVDKFN